MQTFELKLSGVTILQGVEFPVFLLSLAWALPQCSATALPVIIMTHKNQTVTNVPQPHEAENSCMLRCLPKVPIESLMLWRSLGKSFHRRGISTATLNDRSPNMVMQRGTIQRQFPDDPICPSTGVV